MPVVYDSFTDTDATALNSHTPDTDAVGTGWFSLAWISTDTAGGGTIQGNAVQLVTDNGGHGIDAGKADCIIEVDWVTAAAVNNRNSIMFRHASSGNQWALNLREPNGDWRLSKIAANVSTYPVTGMYSWVGGSTYAIKIVLSGNDIELFIDGVSVGTYTDAYNNTATKHGILRNGGDNATRLDNFTVYARAQIPVLQQNMRGGFNQMRGGFNNG